MFKVECPGCKAPYQVDERRVPKAGLKMRCPKCGTSFKVDSPDQPSEAPPPVLGAALGLRGDELPARSRAAAAGLKSTMLGVAAPAELLDNKAPPQRPPPPPRLGRPAPNAPPQPNSAASTRQAPPPPPRRAAPAPIVDDPYSEADLPTLGRSTGARESPPPDDLPVPRDASPPGSSFQRAASSDLELDLPAPVRRSDPSDDLPAVPSRSVEPRQAQYEVDLPTVGARPHPEPPFDLGLPTPSADLPSPVATSDIPLLSLDSVLPTPAADLPAKLEPSQQLPVPKAPEPALPPVPRRQAELPSLGESLPLHAVDLPDLAPEATTLPELSDAFPVTAESLPTAAESLPRVAARESHEPLSLPPENLLSLDTADEPREESFGELELPLGSDPFASSAAADLSSVPPMSYGQLHASQPPSAPNGPGRSSTPAAVPLQRQAGGGTSFGEVNLDDNVAGADVALDDYRPPQVSVPDEEMEFGAIPQEEELDSRSVTAGASQVRMQVGGLPAEPPRRSRGLKLALGALVVVCIGGGSLALVPDIGPFGYYVVTDALRSGEYHQLTERAIADSRKLLAQDTFPSAVQAVEQIEAARAGAPRVPALAAYSAFVAFARELRFGPDPEIHARAKVSLESLHQPDVPHRGLAEAAREAVDGKPANARRALESLVARDRKHVDGWIILAELELAQENAKAAAAAWERASKLEDSARTRYGLARARLASGDLDAAEQLAREALTKEPNHAGAKLLVAQATSRRDSGDDTIALLKDIVAQRAGKLSPKELVTAHILLGNAYLARSRIGLAEAEFGAALKVNPRTAAALRGLGATLHAAARYSEALARYEAAVQADPNDMEAKIGVVQCKLVLERVKEAAALAETLRNTHPKSAVAALWHGRALEASGQREQAEAAYRVAVELSEKDESAVKPYVALSLLLNQLGKADEAQKLLDRARAELPKSPEIYKALGDVALAQGRYEQALAEYDQALALDEGDLSVRFQRGVTLRRARRLEEAQAAFEQVAKVDGDYPGLALERGLLHEAAGRGDEALKAYEAALAKAPDDLDLMLRVGCSYVSAGRADKAEELLRKVLSQRPNSAETNHCMGRAMLLDPARLAEALRLLERAASIDPNRPEYHLYVGWAANEARNFSKAKTALEKALALDQSLADAYWQRGVLLARQGAVKDAIVDLKKALSLPPTRHEAHATLAEAYYDLGREREALAEWRTAITAMPNQAVWRFRYGKLLLANRQRAAAEQELARALELAKNDEPPPRWLAEAHLLLAQSLGQTPAAVEHWEAYLKLGPLNSPYRAEAKRALNKLGRRWTGD